MGNANMEVSAQPIASTILRTEQPYIAWTSTANPQTWITLHIRLLRSLPVGSEPLRVPAFLIEIPEDFEHVISAPSDVKNLNNEFPLQASAWAEYDVKTSIGSYFLQNGSSPSHDLRQIRILRDETRRVPLGTYSWVFPVRVPEELPRLNVWRFSICSVPSCSAADTSTALATFVIPG